MQRVASLMGYELQHGIAAVPDYDALKPAAEALVDRLLDESRRGLIGENVSFDHLHLLACEVCDLPPREARYVAAMIAWKLASLEVKVT